MNETNLILGISGLPPESARNCIQDLTPIPNGEFKRSINGNLLFIETTTRKKYKSNISCKDINSPIIDKIWIGSQLMVGCIQNLWQSIDAHKDSINLIRPAVEHSVRVMNNFGENIKFTLEDNTITLNNAQNEKTFVCFRPWLNMQVINFALETDEWGISCGWKLILEEI